MSRANRSRLEEEAPNELTRRQINADLMARGVDFDPAADIEALAGLHRTVKPGRVASHA